MEQLSNLESLNDSDLRIRASAIIALGQSGDKNAVTTLKTILENKSEVEWVRGCAAIALGRVSGEEGLLPLIAALQDESLLVCRAAISALGDLKNRKSGAAPGSHSQKPGKERSTCGCGQRAGDHRRR